MSFRTIALALPLAALALAGCANLGDGRAQTSQAKLAAAQPAPAKHHAHGQQTAHGSFHGASKHVTTGSAAVFRDGGNWVVSLAEDFSFDGAPAPRVGFGKAGKYDPASQLAALKSNHGAQTYAVPASVDVGKYDEIYVWCEQFSVPLGVARLTLN